MRGIRRTICLILASLLLAPIPLAFSDAVRIGDDLPQFSRYKTIPGVTTEETEAIDQLLEKYDYFLYGMNLSTEAFMDENNEIRGFTALFCDWLTELFGIPFIPEIVEWDDLMSGLASHTIHFSGELTATDERRALDYLFTDTIAERSVKHMRIRGSKPFADIASERAAMIPPQKLRYAFLDESTTADQVAELSIYDFDATFVGDYESAYRMLERGEIDAFFDEGVAEAAFDKYGDIIADEFFPLIYGPVSLTTLNPELKPIISVVQKLLGFDSSRRYLSALYSLGEQEYLKHKLWMTLSEPEKDFIRDHVDNNRSILFLAEYDNYPMSFYNSHDEEWQGIAFDILKSIENLTGLKFVIANDAESTWNELYETLKSGEVPMITELIRSKERENEGIFIWPSANILTDHYALLSKTEDDNISINEILHKKVGLIEGTAHSQLFKNWFPDHKHKEMYTTMQEAFDALKDQEVELIMASEVLLLQQTNYNEQPGYKANIVFDLSFQSTFGFHESAVTLCSIVNEALYLVDTKSISGQWMRRTYDYRAKLAQEREKLAQARLPLVIAGTALIFMLLLMFLMFRRNRNESSRLEGLVQNRTADLNKQHALMSVVNDAAALLLESDTLDYTSTNAASMEMVCRSIDADRVYLWQNIKKSDGKTHFRQVCRWRRGELVAAEAPKEYRYDTILPQWKDIIASGAVLNGPLETLPAEMRDFLHQQDVRSFLAIPLFLKGEFWGFVSLSDIHQDREFPEAEKNALRSWGLLAVSAIQRGIIAQDRRQTLSKLEAVIGNYKGIIWSVDNDRVVTTYDGQYLKEMGITPDTLLGKKLASSNREDHADMLKGVERTFNEGPQDWISDINGHAFHSYTLPMQDGGGNINGVVGSTDDVTEEIRLQRELEQAVVEAEASSRSKSVFLANMSHEIRTPMNSIIGFSELAMDEELTPQVKDYLVRILDNSRWLLQIINDILDISKIESGKMELETLPFDLGEVLSHCQTVITPKALEKNIALHFYAEPVIGRKLLGDPTRLRQVLINILSNAIKFTHVGSVKMSASVKEAVGETCMIHFEIRDSGIGMTAEQIEKIFTPFVQADTSTTRKYGGTGLGLPITKSIVELMGGELVVESAPGIGSRFSFNITFETQEAPAESAAPPSGEIEKPMFSGDTAILVCEDNEMNQRVISEHLKRVGLQATIAENGKIGVEMVKSRIDKGEKPFDIIFMDMHMPVMDGLEAAERILPLKTGSPIIALTANIMSNDRDHYIKSGMDSCMGKPFTSQELWECLLRYLKPVGAAGTAAVISENSGEDSLEQQLKIDFAKGNREKFAEIKQSLEDNDIKLAHRLTHTLKSNAALIGKPGLQKIAMEMEQSLAGGENKIKEEQLSLLETELAAVLQELAPLVEAAQKPREAAEILDKDAALELLNKLEPLLASGNPECLEFTDTLRGIEGSETLIEQMEDFDFRPAAETLAGLKKELEAR
ncbi:MAG: ATP-binding protein [Oscillospiraceae bacterium]|nr:ATP-binding protein [Oscillospiraceae bacterium]